MLVNAVLDLLYSTMIDGVGRQIGEFDKESKV